MNKKPTGLPRAESRRRVRRVCSSIRQSSLSLGIFLVLSALCSIPCFADDIEFQSQGVSLSGSLILPESGTPLHAAVVFVHGSGKQSRNLQIAQRFASDGIAALVYDKRGVGRSGGAYEGEQSVSERNIELLSSDAAAALAALTSHPRLQGIPLGLTGISQAGWIVPLAAKKAKGVDFMVLWSGPVCKVSEEDIYSQFTADLDGARVPSFQEALSAREEPYVWPDFLGKDSDAAEELAKIHMPGLWIFGENDGSVPVDLSIQRLRKLQDSQHDYSYILFSGLGHNNMAETFATATDWIQRKTKQPARPAVEGGDP